MPDDKLVFWHGFVVPHIRVGGCQGDDVLVKGDGLMQPLPRLMQSRSAEADANTVAGATQHSSLCRHYERKYV